MGGGKLQRPKRNHQNSHLSQQPPNSHSESQLNETATSKSRGWRSTSQTAQRNKKNFV